MTALSADPICREHLRNRRRVGAAALTELIGALDDQEAAALNAALPALRRLVEVVAESDAFTSALNRGDGNGT